MRRTPGSTVLLVILVLIDAAFIAADVLQRHGVLHDVRFLVTHDHGYGEIFQYCKAALGCLLLLQMSARRASATAMTWAALLGTVLLDDAFQLHERAGEALAAAMRLPPIGSLRGNQLGELFFYAALGAASLAALALTWLRGDAGERALSRRLFGWFAALGFCAVILDAVSSLTRKTPWAADLALLEDGGEMVVLSVLTATIWSAFEESRVPATVTSRPSSPAAA